MDIKNIHIFGMVIIKHQLLPEFRNKGLTRHIMQLFVDSLPQQVKGISLQVSTSNKQSIGKTKHLTKVTIYQDLESASGCGSLISLDLYELFSQAR